MLNVWTSERNETSLLYKVRQSFLVLNAQQRNKKYFKKAVFSTSYALSLYFLTRLVVQDQKYPKLEESGGHRGGCETTPHARPTDVTQECSYHFQAAALHPLPFMDVPGNPGRW